MHFINLIFTTLFSFFLIACSEPSSLEVWETNSSCDLHIKQCSTTKNKQQIILSIQPNNPIPVAKMLDVKLEIKGLTSKKVALDIAGINMYMGFNRVQLKPVSEGIYQGKSMLAFCTTSKMEWLVSVLITQDDGSVIKVPFKLITLQ